MSRLKNSEQKDFEQFLVSSFTFHEMHMLAAAWGVNDVIPAGDSVSARQLAFGITNALLNAGLAGEEQIWILLTEERPRLAPQIEDLRRRLANTPKCFAQASTVRLLFARLAPNSPGFGEKVIDGVTTITALQYNGNDTDD